jgi:hypothetical protein
VGITRSQGTDAIAAVRSALESCGELAITTGGATTVYPATLAEFDSFGDETLAIKVTTQLERLASPSSGYFVLIRDGGLNLVVSDLYLTTAADPAQTKTIVAAAYEAMQRIAAQ